jgi:hypothetical protein
VKSTACTELTLSGPSVAATSALGERPTPAGGTPADGVYELVEHRIYGMAEGASGPGARQATIRFSNGARKGEMVSASVDEALDRYAFDVSLEGTTMTTTMTCPDPDVGSRVRGTYTATTTEFWGFGDSNDINVYRKQAP